MIHLISFMLIGVAGGIIGGIFGVGGGIIIVPALVLGFGFTQHMAQGTMLATLLLPSFVFAAWKYYQAGHINIQAAIFLSLGMMMGSIIGATCAQTMAAPGLKKAFGILMVVVGMHLIFW